MLYGITAARKIPRVPRLYQKHLTLTLGMAETIKFNSRLRLTTSIAESLTFNASKQQTKSFSLTSAQSHSLTEILPPFFVNAGTYAASGSTASQTPALPGSRVNGNMLLAFLSNGTSSTISVGGGWTIVQTNSYPGGGKYLWAYRAVDGTEAAPVFSWTGNVGSSSRVIQLRRTDSPVPYGNFTMQDGTTTPLTAPTINATKDGSLILAYLLVSNNTAVPTPTGYTNRAATSSGSSDESATQNALLKNGQASTAISVTIANVQWTSIVIEIKAA